MMRRCTLALLLLTAALSLFGQSQSDLYTKYEYRIPMRDGVKLYTSVYVPKNKPGKHPILLMRTPYGAGPYGPDRYRPGHGGSAKFREAGYIFAYQDVRGIHMSEGVFEDMRPQLIVRTGPHDIDESTDTYDTVDYLVKNVPNNNGRVGLWGISYPGGYAALGAINSHPALKAASPQAPTADWFLGDDMHHNGAFFLQDCFSFFSGMGAPKNNPSPGWEPVFRFDLAGDAYRFFLHIGPVRNTNGEKYFNGKSKFWNDALAHPNYDEFWQARSVPHNMKGVRCAMLTVGGWFDAEDLWGPLHVYAHTEKNNTNWNSLVMGPWIHGGWAGRQGSRLADYDFGPNPSEWYRENVEFPFFDAFLRGNAPPKLAEAIMFRTGANQWHHLDAWPPKRLTPAHYYLAAERGLTKRTPPKTPTLEGDSYLSDVNNPVPYEGGSLLRRSVTYMAADQRFAFERPDVLSYQTDPLTQDTTWAGPVWADLWVKITGTDADFVVKVIDVWPNGSKNAAGKDMSGYQQLVRAEVFRGKYRNSFQNPSPFRPNLPERVKFALPDLFHTFAKGHRIMVQIQSSWFPLVDRNPQTFCNIYECGPEAFQNATITILRDDSFPTRITVGEWSP